MDFLIHHMLRSSAARYPEKEAVVHGSRRLTYREVADRCASVASGLRSAGMQRGDRVGIYLDPSVEQVVSIFSISQAGGVYVPINTVLVPDQVAHIARDCGMKALITTADKLEMLLPALQDVSSLQFFVLTGKPNGQDPAGRKGGFQTAYMGSRKCCVYRQRSAGRIGASRRTWPPSFIRRDQRESPRA